MEEAVDDKSLLAKVEAAKSHYRSAREALLEALRPAAKEALTAAREKLAAEPTTYAVYMASSQVARAAKQNMKAMTFENALRRVQKSLSSMRLPV